MKVIQYKESYSSIKAKKLNEGINIGWILTIAAVFSYLAFEVIFVDIQLYWPLIFICVCIIVIFAAQNKDYRWLRERLSFYKKGDVGEALVRDKLISEFDNNYIYVMNYSHSGIISGDIDGILLGPRGVFLLEVKNWHGYFHVFAQNIYRRIGKNLFTPYKSPIEQLDNNKQSLIQYLQGAGVSIAPRAFIVLVNGKVEAITGNTKIFITNPEEISGKIMGSSDQNLSNEEINKILTALEISLGDSKEL